MYESDVISNYPQVVEESCSTNNLKAMTEKVNITFDDGSVEETTMHPVIVSASRATDIPAFYADWFFYRLQKGYSAWINPFNNKKGYVSYQDTRFIVFWSKMPDKGQRAACGCMVSKDIGQYNTCPHQCEYCYANASKELATENWHRHQLDPHSELIIPQD